jgi:hypothetical protein
MTVPDRPFTLSDLESLGITRSQLRTLVLNGDVRRPLHGVYCSSLLPDTQELRAQCAALALPPHSVVCDRSAAWIHGIDTFDLTERALPPPLEVVAVGGSDRSRRAEVYGGKRRLRPDEVMEIEGVRVTTPLRTACDLARLRGRHSALAALDAFMRKNGITNADLVRVLPRLRGQRGVVQLRQLVPLASPLRESTGESFTAVAIEQAGLPQPTPQVWVDLDGFGRVRLDHAYEELKIAVEYDGEEHHSSEAARERDLLRRTALERAGWLVIVVRKRDFTGSASELWSQRLRRAIEERRPQHRREYPRGEQRGPRRRRTG